MTATMMGGTVTRDIRDVPDENEAFVRLVQATEGAACPVHVAGPLAHHLVGPISALRPDWHPRQNVDRSQYGGVAAVERLVARAFDLPSGAAWACGCPEGFQRSPLVYVVPALGELAIARPPQDVAAVDAAVLSGDPDEALGAMDARVDSLLILSDLARAVAGGDLPAGIADDVRTLAASLVGRERWDVLRGYEKNVVWDWPISWRFGPAALRASQFLAYPEVGDVIVRRMVEGR